MKLLLIFLLSLIFPLNFIAIHIIYCLLHLNQLPYMVQDDLPIINIRSIRDAWRNSYIFGCLITVVVA